jgi:hypothetical protein
MISKKSLLKMVEITDYKSEKVFFDGRQWIKMSCIMDGWYSYWLQTPAHDENQKLKTKSQLIQKAKIEFLGGLLLDRIPEKCNHN